MPAALHILGIRHHGPGSARTVGAALAALKPDAVLIEGPPDAADVLPLAASKEMKPPVALLVYEPDNPREAAYYPFAEFSPEWQAIRWALKAKAELRFIDLPFANRLARHKGEQDDDEALDATSATPPEPPELPSEEHRSADPLDALARAAGLEDGEAWWSRLIEERRGHEDPAAVFAAIHDAMDSVRWEVEEGKPDSRPGRDHDDPQREAHMRRCIRAAIKEGHERIAVVCGAWHAPVLTADALASNTAKHDDALLKALPKRKTASTWIPWTYSRLARFSGYGAGVESPGWYEHLWVHHDQAPGRVSIAWMSRVARLMRDEDLDASPAHTVEAVRLADALASLRGRAIAGLDELTEATLAILCHGNVLPLRIISSRLIVGEKLGEVPDEAPAVPLQRDLAAQQKSLRLKVSADDVTLDLDQRKEIDLARSRLLHRLSLLGIEWGKPELDQRQRTSTFHELWKLQWKPELAVAVIEAAQWGNTVRDAATGCVRERAEKSTDLPGLTNLLDHTLLADLPDAVEPLLGRIQALSAVAADIAHLMQAVPPLARILRYGNVRKTDAAMVAPVVRGLVARVCAGLLPACASLNDDAAAEMLGHVDAVSSALATLEASDLLAMWRERLRALGDAGIHGLIAGRAWRLLLDAQVEPAEEVASRLSLALSRGNDAAKASAWLEGFLSSSGSLLVHDPRLLSIVDGWVCGLGGDAFDQTAPIVRRTFSTFHKPERRQIGEAIARVRTAAAPAAPSTTETDYNAARGEMVTPILRLILGEDLP